MVFLFPVYSKLHGLGWDLAACLLMALSASVAKRISRRACICGSLGRSSGSCGGLVSLIEAKSWVVILATFWSPSHLGRMFLERVGQSRVLMCVSQDVLES